MAGMKKQAWGAALWAAVLLGPTTGLFGPITALTAGAQDVATVPVLQILQRTQGAGVSLDPDSPKEAPVLQRLTVDSTGRLISLEWLDPSAKTVSATGQVTRQVILRMDGEEPTLYELSPTKRTYREQAGDLNRHQLDRRIADDAIIQSSKRMTREEREQLLKENYLRLDGSRDVELKTTAGGELLGRKCERVEITENGRRIIDAQVSREVPGATSYFHLYRRLGAFSEEVLDKMEGMDGVPLKAKITVVTALPARQIEVDVLEVQGASVPASFFRPPAGFQKERVIPDNARCAYCGESIEDPESPGAQLRMESGAIVLFDSEEHFEAFLDAQEAGLPVPAQLKKSPALPPATKP